MKCNRSPRAVFVFFFAASLAACQQSGQTDGRPDAEQSAPEAKPGISLSEGKLLLPVVAGRPGAAYFKLRNGSDKAVTLAGAYIEGAAEAQLHETRAGEMAMVDELVIGAGQTVSFERGGLHVMAFELSGKLAENSAAGTEITLTFADGDKLSAPLSIETMVPQAGHATHGDGN